jgi:hypothetical protein
LLLFSALKCVADIAGYLPVFSCVLVLKWLIINGIRFSGVHAFAGSFSCQPWPTYFL